MNKKGFIAIIVTVIGVFTISGAMADLGDVHFDTVKALPNNAGHTAGTTLNPEGRGDVLIFPYYDVRKIEGKAQDNYIAIINESGECEGSTVDCVKGMAAKLRFREWDHGDEVFNTDIWLSRGDVWVGLVTQDANNRIAQLWSPDWVIVDHTEQEFILQKSLDVRDPLSGALLGKPFRPDLIPIPNEKSLYGFLEVIGEERTSDNQSGGKVARSGLDAPNQLMGYAYIVRVADGSSFGYNAKAFANFSRNQGSLFRGPGSSSPTLMNCEDTLDQLEFQMAKQKVAAGYSIEDSIVGQFSLVLTFPTKHFHFCEKPSYGYKGDPQAPCSPTYPLGPPFEPITMLRQVYDLDIFDRNENKMPPCHPGYGVPYLCEHAADLHYGVNIIGLYKTAWPPYILGRDNTGFATEDPNIDSGYITVKFPNKGVVQELNPKIIKFLHLDLFFSGYEGLPVLGLALQEFQNDNVGGFYGDTRDVFYGIEWSP